MEIKETERFRFPKAEKLYGNIPIDDLFTHGTSFSRYPLRVTYLEKEKCREGEAALRMMVSVGKKRFKRAVKRNRVKRQIREAYRLKKRELEAALGASEKYEALHVAFVFIGKGLPTTEEIFGAMDGVVEKLCKVLSVAE